MIKSAKTAPAHRLALRLREIGQLFNSMAPTSFLNKDIDPEPRPVSNHGRLDMWPAVVFISPSILSNGRQMVIPPKC
jgi:hypothetical protein